MVCGQCGPALDKGYLASSLGLGRVIICTQYCGVKCEAMHVYRGVQSVGTCWSHSMVITEMLYLLSIFRVTDPTIDNKKMSLRCTLLPRSHWPHSSKVCTELSNGGQEDLQYNNNAGVRQKYGIRMQNCIVR